MSKRTAQAASTLQRAIQQVIGRGFADPRIRGLVTVTEVVVAEDLREATVRVSVLPQEHEELTLHGLRAAAKHIRHEASELVALARMPALRIKPDRRPRDQAGTLAAINRAMESITPSKAVPGDLSAPSPQPGAAPEEHE